MAWEVNGAVDEVGFCVTDGSPSFTCTDLPGPTGIRPVSSGALAPGAYTGWLEAAGPGGAVESAPVDLAVLEADEDARGCGAVPSPGRAGVLSMGLALLLALRHPRREVGDGAGPRHTAG